MIHSYSSSEIQASTVIICVRTHKFFGNTFFNKERELKSLKRRGEQDSITQVLLASVAIELIFPVCSIEKRANK